MALMSLGIADVTDDTLMATVALKTDEIQELTIVVCSSLASGVNVLLRHKYYSI